MRLTYWLPGESVSKIYVVRCLQLGNNFFFLMWLLWKKQVIGEYHFYQLVSGTNLSSSFLFLSWATTSRCFVINSYNAPLSVLCFLKKRKTITTRKPKNINWHMSTEGNVSVQTVNTYGNCNPGKLVKKSIPMKHLHRQNGDDTKQWKSLGPRGPKKARTQTSTICSLHPFRNKHQKLLLCW